VNTFACLCVQNLAFFVPARRVAGASSPRRHADTRRAGARRRSPSSAGTTEATVTMCQSHYRLILLCLFSTINFLDVRLISMLSQPIQTELQLSDSALGLVMGGPIVGALPLASSLLFGLLADTWPRRGMLAAGCLAMWSILTCAHGFVITYWQLVGVRLLALSFESARAPLGASLISDLYGIDGGRASALGAFQATIDVGTALSALIGGVAESAAGWRATFVIAGLPGLALAAVTALTFTDPTRADAAAGGGGGARGGGGEGEGCCGCCSGGGGVVRRVWSSRAYRAFSLGLLLHAFTDAVLRFWLPLYVLRYSSRVSSASVGAGLAASELSQILSKAVGGILVDKLSRRDIRWFAWQCALGKLALLPLMALWFRLPLGTPRQANTAMACLLLPNLFNGLQASPQSESPARTAAHPSLAPYSRGIPYPPRPHRDASKPPPLPSPCTPSLAQSPWVLPSEDTGPLVSRSR
jgi:MFS family permease